MEVGVLDLSQKTTGEKENGISTAMDLSHKRNNVTLVSEDEEDDIINNLIAKINMENPSPDDIEACQKLLHKLDEKLRNEETIKILLSQMKMTQRRSNLQNGGVTDNKHNGVSSDGKPTESLIPSINDVGETNSHVNVDEINGSMIRAVASIVPSSVDKVGMKMTREMAMQALDQQYMARKALLRKQADKSLTEIPLARPSQRVIAQSDVNLVPSTTTNEFVALVGLEEVVKNLQEYRNIAMGHKPTDLKLLFSPFNCVQCETDFTPLWKRERPGSSSVVCETCCSHNYRKAVQKDYQEKIKLVLKKYQDQEHDLDRDYKDMLDSPKKFELFRKEQEKKLLAVNNSAHRLSASNMQHNQTIVRTTTGHHNQTALSTSVTQQPNRSTHKPPNIISNSNRPPAITISNQQYSQQTVRHQNSNSSAVSAVSNTGSQLSVDQMAYMQMFQALNQLGSSNTMNPQASRQQQQLMQQILQMAYMSSASTLLGGSSNTAAANSFVQLLGNMAGLMGVPSSQTDAAGPGNSSSSSSNNTMLNYYLSILQQQQQQASSNSDK